MRQLFNTNWTPTTRTEQAARQELLRLNRTRSADHRRELEASRSAEDLAAAIRAGQSVTLSAGDAVDGWRIVTITRAGDAGMDALSAEFSRRGIIGQVIVTRPRGHRPHMANIGPDGKIGRPRAM